MQQPPDIIFIITDQQRFDTIQALGNNHMVTPNLDQLSRRSISFNRSYCPAATCVASRAAIFTGMYPHVTGATSFDPWGSQPTWIEDLNRGGYFCSNVGKMHFIPLNHEGGFHDRMMVENPTNKNAWGKMGEDAWGKHLNRHGANRPNDRHLTDPRWKDRFQCVPWQLDEHLHSDVFIGDSAAGLIRSYRGEKPLFLQVGFTGPHEPWDPLPRHLAAYDQIKMPSPVKDDLRKKPPQHLAMRKFHAQIDHESQIDLSKASQCDIEQMRKHYAAKITTVDEQVGKIMDALEESGRMNNSWIFFTSDHGEMLGDHGIPYKWLMYEPVVHVPLLVKPPSSHNIADSATDDLVSLIDLGPTVLECAGLEIPDRLDGRSLAPYFKADTAISPREFVVAQDNYMVMLRTINQKLVVYLGEDYGELYNLEDDPDEIDNLWDQPECRQSRDALRHQLLSWMAETAYWHLGSTDCTRRRDPRIDASLHGAKALSPYPMEKRYRLPGH